MTLCDNTVTKFVSVSNEAIVFMIPKGVNSCSAGVVESTLTVNSISHTISASDFYYDSSLDPTITSLSKDSSSPIIKSTLIITGSGFRTQATTRVFLVNSNGDRAYELTVVQVSSTEIECILGGGRSG